MRARVAMVTVALLLVSCSCASGSDSAQDDITDAPSAQKTLWAPSASAVAPRGGLRATMSQSSIDASRGQMTVWVANDTTADLLPSAVVYGDGRLPTPLRVAAARLRAVPAGSERGFPLVLPERLDCDSGRTTRAAEGSGRLVVRTAKGARRIRVEDETDVVGRFVTLRCSEQRLAEVAAVRWADEVPLDPGRAGGMSTLTLVVDPTGIRGRVLRIDSVTGSHLLGSADGASGWKPGVVIRSDGPPARVPLPLKPARCDEHGFVEGGGATAFRVRFHLDGEPGEVLLRMGDAGRRAAFAFARESCGLD